MGKFHLCIADIQFKTRKIRKELFDKRDDFPKKKIKALTSIVCRFFCSQSHQTGNICRYISTDSSFELVVQCSHWKIRIRDVNEIFWEKMYNGILPLNEVKVLNLIAPNQLNEFVNEKITSTLSKSTKYHSTSLTR